MTSAYFNNNGADLFYIVEGTGAPILLIHGWTCDHLDWSWQQPFLQSLGFQTIAIDQRGHGRSTILPGNDYGPETLADDAAALLIHLGIGETIVMGHSLGTAVASALAVRHPQKVKALVLVDPIYHLFGEQLEPFVAFISQPNSPANAAFFFDQNFYTDATPAWLKAWHRHRTLGNPPRVVTAVIEQLYGKEGSIGRRENAVTYNKRRTCPRLVTCADQVKVDLEQEIGLNTETDRVELIPSGHWHHQQDSETFNAVVKAWLEAQGYLPNPSS
ncbi:Alpha/beta hydrolase fold-1 [Macrophomina phaseolina MS6]|uniref:Alpha/beta hydrolase fold-1 n=2 Tax=Macrophomina phaseolina TaxID=35725 RepID=K2SR04_MACPH|nr:Alpha/beta hydrolase fold-1 [Macrophomina phaseolina MS6]KAH7054367.1 Alpha/Beta hydrolase protein [Macrophomina phaseolina]